MPVWPTSPSSRSPSTKSAYDKRHSELLRSAVSVCIHFKITSPFSASTVRLPPAFRVPSMMRSAAGSSTALRMVAGNVLAVQNDVALGGLIDAGQHVKDRRLARAVGADEPDQLGLANFHVEVIHSLQAAELDAEMLCFQYGCCHNGFTLLSRLLPWGAECRPTGGSG